MPENTLMHLEMFVGMDLEQVPFPRKAQTAYPEFPVCCPWAAAYGRRDRFVVGAVIDVLQDNSFNLVP